MGIKVLVFGKNGQVALALQEYIEKSWNQFSKNDFVFISSQDCTFENLDAIESVLDQHHPLVVINAAAYTKVDLAEKEEAKAMMVNALAPEKIAQWCARNNSLFIHYSTDYVFDGSGSSPWREDSSTRPLNIYGKTKCEGEKKIQALGGHFLIFRTSWVYYHKGQNFVLTMLKLGAEREQLKIVSDQFGAPTYAGDIAEATLKVVSDFFQNKNYPTGIYHLVNSGETTWFGFAQEIFKQSKKYNVSLKVKDVLPIESKDYPTPAKRPLNSRLSIQKLKNQMNIQLPEWKTSLETCLRKLYAS